MSAVNSLYSSKNQNSQKPPKLDQPSNLEVEVSKIKGLVPMTRSPALSGGRSRSPSPEFFTPPEMRSKAGKENLPKFEYSSPVLKARIFASPLSPQKLSENHRSSTISKLPDTTSSPFKPGSTHSSPIKMLPGSTGSSPIKMLPGSTGSSPIKMLPGSTDSSPIKMLPASPDSSAPSSPVKPTPKIPPRPQLARRVNLSLNTAFLGSKKDDENTKTNPFSKTSPEPRALGRDLNESERHFATQVETTMALAEDPNTPEEMAQQVGIFHLQRGTYLIKTIDPAVVKLFSQKEVADSIAGFSNLPATTLIKANTYCLGVFKPAEGVRGGPKQKPGILGTSNQPNAAKPGISWDLEIPNEMFATRFPLQQDVVSMSLTSPSLYHPKAEDPTTPVHGVAISFLEGMVSLDKVKTNRHHIISAIPKRFVQDLAIMDLATGNVDRNASNLMVSKQVLTRAKKTFSTRNKKGILSIQKGEICAIDQANLLSCEFLAPARFFWLQWPKAKLPFDEASKRKIEALDAQTDSAKLKALYPHYPQENLEMMEMTYHILKQGAALNLTPSQIGLFYYSEGEIPSLITQLYALAKTKAEGSNTPVIPLFNQLMTNTMLYFKTHHADVKDLATWNKNKIDSILLGYGQEKLVSS